MLNYRKINVADDETIARIIRHNLEKLHLDIPGTAYFDPELNHLSTYYNAAPDKRTYFIALDEANQVAGWQRIIFQFLLYRPTTRTMF